MMLISYMIQNYFGIPFQMFTEKIIAGYSVLTVVEGATPEDIERIKWIQKNTSEEVMVSLYKLDRSVNPGRGMFNISQNKKRFIKNNCCDEERDDGNCFIEMDEDNMQRILCEAINEVHQIVSRNIKGYKEEIKFDNMSLDSDDDKSKKFSF